MLVTKTSVHLLLLRSPLSDFTTHYGPTSWKVCPGKFEWSRVIFHGSCSLSLIAVDEKMLRKLFFSHLSRGSYSTRFQMLPDVSHGKLNFCIFNCVSALCGFFFIALTPRLFFFSFRFFCQHFANIPEVGGHALHYGQDPSAWGPPSAALCRLGVNVFQMAVTPSCYCSATGAVDL